MIFGLLMSLAALLIDTNSTDSSREFAELVGLNNFPPFTFIEEMPCASTTDEGCTAVSSANISRARFQDSLGRELGEAGWRRPAPVEGYELGSPLIPDSLVRRWINDSGEACNQRMAVERARSTGTLRLTVSTFPCQQIALLYEPGPQIDWLEAILGISVGQGLSDKVVDCAVGDTCLNSDITLNLDESTFSFLVDPALQAAGWEPLMMADSVHGGSLNEVYVRAHNHSSTGHITCADRLDAFYPDQSSNVRLTIQFASCEATQ